MLEAGMYVVCFAAIHFYVRWRERKVRDAWATMVRSLIRGIDAGYDAGKPMKIGALSFDGVDLIKEEQPLVHVVHQGAAACDAGVPDSWPKGTSWVGLSHDLDADHAELLINCAPCLQFWKVHKGLVLGMKT